ncbi:MAG: hypothetical protein PHC62_09640 [Candidatus Izemoplasmatales bacterium]|nr:hypothetical protein [Candidatus Izemoplasmatales bacterium]
MNKYVIINGIGGCGKDEVVNQCSIIKDNVFNISTIDFVKQIAILCGWKKEKNEKSRKFLSDLKDAMIAYDNIPFKKVCEIVKVLNNKIIFIHCREPNEIDKLKQELNARTLLVRNSNIAKIKTNHADGEVENYKYDYVLDNNGTRQELFEECKDFLHWLEVNYEEI